MKRALPVSVLLLWCAMAVAAAAAPSIPLSDVIAHYPFDDTSGNYFVDAGSYGNNATFYRPPYVSEIPTLDVANVAQYGLFGGGVALGTQNVNVGIETVPHQVFVDIPTLAGLPGAGDTFAVSFWLNVPNWTTGYGMVTAYNHGGLEWSIGLDSATDSLLVWSSDGDPSAGTDVAQIVTGGLTPNAYSHFLIQFDGTAGVTNLFVDTFPVADAGGTSYFWGSTEESFLLGGRIRTDRGLGGLTGLLDDFAIIGGEVDSGQATELAWYGAASYAASHPGTVIGHWALDETAGTTVQDSSAGAHHGTVHGYDPVGDGREPRDVGPASVDGVHGNASQFRSGWNEYGLVETPTNMPAAGDDFTVSFWAKCPDWVNDDALIMTQNLGGLSFTIGLHNASNGIIVRTNFGAAQMKGITLTTLPANEFAHFAITFDDVDGIRAIYLNGDLVAPDVTNGWLAGDDGVVALSGRIRSGNLDGYGVEGALDDYAVIRGILTEAQIEQIIAGGVSSIVSVGSVPGDTGNDGVVDATDAAVVAKNWLGTVAGGRLDGDFNNDTKVDDLDLAILAANWSAAPPVGGTVPEPSTLAILIGACAALALARRR
ncbi:MAG: PEP-CTERM sorting domain-containing protein [Pirellulales bacterium]|nr:PEP-CTERM sorting domain-containing protein [Pirellulales bacterium]